MSTKVSSPPPSSKDPIYSPEADAFGRPEGGSRRKLFTVIFESDTQAGKVFDVSLLFAIIASVLVVMLGSVQSLAEHYQKLFSALEWSFTLLFTVEYIARLSCVERPGRYARSFFGIVDLIAILPTYLAFFFPELMVLINIRLLRLLRVFRILKLTAYFYEYNALGAALAASRRKILVFICTVAIIVVLLGTVMYVVEGTENGFTSIPIAVYWSITTMTTVGFGDIVPKTDLGHAIASIIMLLGWGVLAVPTGIVTAEMTSRRMREDVSSARSCEVCGTPGHRLQARYCQDCGAKLPES
ncbi:ion transporter [Nitrosomonas communis]|uniref:Voltage-gated potassium channel n=1 Tax=Nitrosomonas communis TaxID=44574 RepID=A0A1I4U8B1_9PROT|nr:ion transporter [Nitrosomonas communis]SFM85155.1 voltage-gated potassium channel [Nitrosomonas communis]